MSEPLNNFPTEATAVPVDMSSFSHSSSFAAPREPVFSFSNEGLAAVESLCAATAAQDPKADVPGPALDAQSSAGAESRRGPDASNLKACVALEIFAGSCRLSKCLRASGFETVAVDVKDAAGHQVLKLDLLSIAGLTVLWDVLSSGQILYVHMAPPCSTASAARFIPGGPRPLRDALHPDGLEGLSFSQRFQVHNANRLYALCRDVALFCHRRGIGWSIENPSSSLFWMTSPMVHLQNKLVDDVCTVVFDHCCWGGDRPKRTALWSNLPCLGSLEALCTPALQHVHKPWGRLPDGSWSTKAEAAYPLPLCRFWAQLLRSRWDDILSQKGLRPDVNWSGPARLFEARRALGLFPRGRHPSEVKNPFSEQVHIRVPLHTPVSLLVPGSDARISGAPKGCKVLSAVKEQEAWLVLLGVPCEPEEFMASARSFRHPAECEVTLPADLEHTLSLVSKLSCAELASRRCQFLHSLLQRAQELSHLERQLHDGLAPHARTVLQGKRLLLLEELLRSLSHEDTKLVPDICSGFRLTGWLEPSGVMEPKITAPSQSASNLWRQRSDLNRQVWSQTKPTGSPELDEALWQATVKDASSGWAMLLPPSDGPPDDVLLSRRFGVVQGSKVRGVDDFSFNGLNETLGTCEKVTTMSTVHTTALGIRLLRIAKARGMKLLGRCFDLKSAYRQLPVHLEDLPYSAVTVWSPADRAVRVLQMFALPFGAGGSVPGFVRVSLGLWRVMCRLALVPATLFFDDYTCLVLESDAPSAEASVHLLFRILGWRLALEGDKAASFSQQFQSLGVLFCLHPGVDSCLSVTNTDSRKAEIAAWCLDKLRCGEASPKECEQFAGRVRWLSGQVFGRTSCSALRALLSAGRADRPYTARPLSHELAWAIRWILEHVPKGRPKVWSLNARRKLHLFTDGAFEQGVASIGGVLCDGWCQPLQYFGCQVPGVVTSQWLSMGCEHPIIQAELLAAAVSLQYWKDILQGSNTCVWVDNEVVRFGVINGSIRPESAMTILNSMLHLEAACDVNVWVCRVPSHSNPADGPSRGLRPGFLSQAKEVKVDVGALVSLASGH